MLHSLRVYTWGRRAALLALLTLLPLPTVLAGSRPAGAAPVGFADPAFAAVWERTDRAVAESKAQRSWYWGPAPGFTAMELDKDAPGGQRRVQYFDKTRMEINDPSGDPTRPFFVTNGLLAAELMRGQMQVGNADYVARCPAEIPLASDVDDPTAPTYATFGKLMSAPKRPATGDLVTAVVTRAGTVTADPAKAAVPGGDLVYYEPITGRNIPSIFWDFLNTSGTISVGGQYTTGKVNDPWFVASGLPLTEAYWAHVKIAGVYQDVLIQGYERRVLTYIPAYNGSPFNVQMGNVGQHYYDWRYKGAGCAAGSGTDLPRYAVDPIGNSDPQILAAANAGGARVVRLYASWGDIAPADTDPSAYNWATTDAVFARVSGAGLQAIGLVTGCPAWACTRGEGPLDKTTPARFGAFMAALATRYSAPPYNVHLWEIWNEPDATSGPDHQGGFGMHGDQYAALLQAATPLVRAADPTAHILMGGLGYEWFMDEYPNPGPFNRHFLPDVVAAGGAPYFDYLNFHYYPQNPHWPSVADKVATLRGVLSGLGVTKPLVCTEIGLTSSTDPRWTAPGWPLNNEEVQSRFLVRAFTEGLGSGLSMLTWFTVRDWDSGNPGYKIFLETGLTRRDGSAKPALTAYRTLTREVAARPFLRRLDIAALGSPGLDGYAFGAPGDEVWVVWSRTAAVVPVAVAGRGPQAFDMYGTALSAGPVSAGPNPVYLEFHGSH